MIFSILFTFNDDRGSLSSFPQREFWINTWSYIYLSLYIKQADASFEVPGHPAQGTDPTVNRILETAQSTPPFARSGAQGPRGSRLFSNKPDWAVGGKDGTAPLSRDFIETKLTLKKMDNISQIQPSSYD